MGIAEHYSYNENQLLATFLLGSPPRFRACRCRVCKRSVNLSLRDHSWWECTCEALNEPPDGLRIMYSNPHLGPTLQAIMAAQDKIIYAPAMIRYGKPRLKRSTDRTWQVVLHNPTHVVSPKGFYYQLGGSLNEVLCWIDRLRMWPEHVGFRLAVEPGASSC